MREKDIEKKLSLMVKKAGGIAVKFVSPSFDGMPDRLVLLPDGVVAFVELKAPGKAPRPTAAPFRAPSCSGRRAPSQN